MIEVEKKFILTKEQEENLIAGAEFLGEKKFTDIYYDDAEFSLTKKDVWLRSRDGRFELKIPMNNASQERIADAYEELEHDKDIVNYFGQNIDQGLGDFLVKKGIVPFCKITTTRKKYKKEGFGIDLDVMDFGYTIAEIESMINDASKIQEATDAIIVFAKKHNITGGSKWGKVIEYLRKNNPQHFQALLDAWVI